MKKIKSKKNFSKAKEQNKLQQKQILPKIQSLQKFFLNMKLIFFIKIKKILILSKKKYIIKNEKYEIK